MKIKVLGVFVLGIVAMTSCNKTYHCNCVNQEGEIVEEYEFTSKKSNAEAICDAEEGYKYGDYQTCELL
jgi:hypothetical protein